jgi:L-threonylcarbamoyladenylate synthase
MKIIKAESCLWVNEVVDCLRRGGIISYPTETVYGIGGDATNDKVIDLIHTLKGRDARNPMLVLVAQSSDVIPIVRTVSEKAESLMRRFWPGPLTLVFEVLPVVPESILGEGEKLGIRISPDPVCDALVRIFRKPLISTSANPHGEEPAQSASEVSDYFGDSLDMIVDGGKRIGGVPSTVLDVSVDPPALIREGAVKKEDIEGTIGGIAII